MRVASRVLILLLVSGIGLGSSLLDGCLVACHPGEATSARTGHCHTVAASAAATHVQAVPSCCHDDTSKPSEPGGRHVTPSVPSQIGFAEAPFSLCGVATPVRFDRLRPFGTAASPIPSPLRV